MSRYLGIMLIWSLGLTPALAEVVHRTMQVSGNSIEYDVILPVSYDPQKAYPGVLAFGGGPQTVEIDQRIIGEVWRENAERRGYIVVIPAAPGGHLYFQGSERFIPQFLAQILRDYKIQGQKFRVAGQSNGGISAFQVAAAYPQLFTSITAMPGFLLSPTPERVAAISSLCVHMFVGENDELGFGSEMEKNASLFRAKGMALSYSVERNEPHRIGSLHGTGAARLFDQFESDQSGCMKGKAG